MARSSLTAADVYRRALRRIGEDADSDRFAPAELLEWVDEANLDAICGKLSARHGWIEGLPIEGRDTLVSLVASQYEYPLDPMIKTITAVEYLQSDTRWVKLEYEAWREQSEFDTGFTSPDPLGWFRRRNLICFVPVPAETKANSIRVHYLTWSSEITAATDKVLGGLEEWYPHQRILIPFVASRILDSDGKTDLAAVKMAEFEDALLAVRRHRNTANQASFAPIRAKGYGEDVPEDRGPRVLDIPWGS